MNGSLFPPSVQIAKTTLATLVFVLLGGCADEPGCREDLFTPAVTNALANSDNPTAMLMASVLSGYELVQQKAAHSSLPSVDALRHRAAALAGDDEEVLSFLVLGCRPESTRSSTTLCTKEKATKLRDLNPDNGFYWANLAAKLLLSLWVGENESTDFRQCSKARSPYRRPVPHS